MKLQYLFQVEYKFDKWCGSGMGGDGMFRQGIDPAKDSALENIGLYWYNKP